MRAHAKICAEIIQASHAKMYDMQYINDKSLKDIINNFCSNICSKKCSLFRYIKNNYVENIYVIKNTFWRKVEDAKHV